ncbi:hypothetical protein FALBO_15846 [Fusarium albosuccineum]|uniref:Transcription factor domain-containing protein n=1 Tax=Fusarium albosuccineum TaxID=1237068 RepID=A0A8H4PB14_9HYPO|nr:hypothetical protein FALBO_15846 [Fusarium albosuccineum]
MSLATAAGIDGRASVGNNTRCRYEQPADPLGLHLDGNLDQLLTSRLFNTLTTLNIDLEELVEAYLRSVHHWVPLIRPSTLRDWTAVLRNTPLAELATFVLHLLLVVPPSEFPCLSGPNLLRRLYKGCKEAFSFLQAHRRESLLTIQSGIVLAIYEQSKRLYSDGYVSLSASASLGYAMGLDSATDPEDPLTEEKRLLWQVIYFGDVLNKLSFERCGRPDLIPAYDTFAKHSTLWDQSPGPTDLPLGESSASPVVSGVTYIDCQAQAVQILQNVLRLTRDKGVRLETLLDHETWKLDFAIQEGIRDAINTPQKRLEHQYGLVVIFLLSTYELHKRRLACISDQQGSAEIKKISVAALETALNVTKDLLGMDEDARSFNARIFDEDMMPITVVMLMQQAGSTALLLESEYQLDTGDVFQLAIRSLKVANSRWVIADTIAMELEKSRAEVLSRNDAGY